jgi:acyl-CoA dehydrogenase
MTTDEPENRRAIRDAVRALCARFPDAYWREIDAAKAYPADFVAALTEAGYLACLIPEAYGGSGLGVADAAAVLEEIHAAGGNGAACHAQMYTMGTILRHGSAEQKARILPDIAAGRLRLQAFGVTEPTSGTDSSRIQTRAERHPDGGWVLSGQKVWTSRAEYSDLMLVLARTQPRDAGAKPHDGMSVFLLDLRDAEGVAIRPIETMLNHHTTEVFLDGVRVPDDALIGAEGAGFKAILDGMNAERILIAAECLGDARFFVDRATAYANDRRVFDRPIGRNQGVQFPIARAYAEAQAAALMTARAAALYDAGEPAGAEANMAKLLASEASWRAADMCLQTHGGFGFARDFDIERKFRETRLYQVAPVSTNMILAFIAEKVLGLPKSY